MQTPTAHAAPASTDDLDTLVELMQEFYAESDFPLDREWARRSLATLLDQPSLGGIWVMRIDGAVAGHVVLSVRHSMEFGGPVAYIDDLYVRPAYRWRGAARAGFDSLVEEARRRGCHALFVEVGRNNAAAVALYRQCGLSEIDDGRVWLSGPLPDQS